MRLSIAARSSRGQATAEFAVALPLLVVLSLGIINFATGIYAYNYVSYAAREATRYAAARGSSSPKPASATDVRSFVLNETAGLNPGHLAVNTTWSPDNNPDSVVKVQVQYSFAFSVPFVQLNPLTLSSTSQMVISQ